MEDFYLENSVYYFPGSKKLQNAVERQRRQVEKEISQIEADLSMLAVTDKALAEIEDLLWEMQELAIQAAGDGRCDKEALNRLFQGKKRSIDEIIKNAGYKGVNLLDGSCGSLTEIIAAINSSFKDLDIPD